MGATIINGAAGIPLDALAQLPDQMLIAMMTQGDEQALGGLYDRHGRLVYSLALHLTGDQVTAEEVTADVFQHMWTAAVAIRAAYNSGNGWIIAITRQHATKALRRHLHAREAA